jgi:chromosome segregation ATPase
MKTRVVIWTKTTQNEQENRSLTALQLRPEENKVESWTFPADVSTDELRKSLMDDWRMGKEYAFPEGVQHESRPLSASDDILPAGFSTDEAGILDMAKKEWQFIVLSNHAFKTYLGEMDVLKDRIEALTTYDRNLWDELKTFWERVQGQIRERNIYQEHASQLREVSNGLFDRMKAFRTEMDNKFEAEATENFNKIDSVLREIEAQIEAGRDFNRTFNQLRQLQDEYRTAKLGRDVRNALWDRIDLAFKNIKDKRFGQADSERDRLEKRIQGLDDAIGKMEQSIARDEREMGGANYTPATQLENQLREAKNKLVIERVNSKKEKLADMRKTHEQISKRLERLIKDDEKRQATSQAKAQAEERIKAEAEAKLSENKEQLEKAQAQIQETVVETPVTESAEPVAESAVNQHNTDAEPPAEDEAEA